MALTFEVAEISYSPQMRREPKITEIAFDNGGYKLRMSKGMNSDLQTWDIPFNVCSIQSADNIEQFFAYHGGVEWFFWIPPRQKTPRKFICKRWTREPVQGSKTHDRMTAVFEEVCDIF